MSQISEAGNTLIYAPNRLSLDDANSFVSQCEMTLHMLIDDWRGKIVDVSSVLSIVQEIDPRYHGYVYLYG